MPLDDDVRAMLDATPVQTPLRDVAPQMAREAMAAASVLMGPGESVHEVRDLAIPRGTQTLRARLFRPTETPELPVVVYFHGGGWVVGSIETHDAYCRSLANAAGVAVVSVDYRLAPEHRFPAAADDAFLATQWVHQHAASLGCAADRMAVMGDSAGGNLAAAVTLMSRDRGGPALRLQILIYPITDCDFSRGSYLEFATDYFLTRDNMIWFWEQYVGDLGGEPELHYAAPLRAELHQLPPALVITAEYDPLRDEGEAYARKLLAAGGRVELVRFPGVIHGFVRRLKEISKARAALETVSRAICREVFGD